MAVNEKHPEDWGVKGLEIGVTGRHAAQSSIAIRRQGVLEVRIGIRVGL